MKHRLLRVVLFFGMSAALFTTLNVSALAQEQEVGASDLPNVGQLDDTTPDVNATSPITLSYFAIFYGPSMKGPTSYQPDSNGAPDSTRPLLLKNFLGLGFNVTDELNISGNAFWTMVPVMNKDIQLMDPFVKVSHNSILSTGNFNLYGDLRFHLPSSRMSRDSDLRYGVQTVQALTYVVEDTDLVLGLVGSVRGNSYGDYGSGSDLELYFSPNLYYQFTPTLAFTLLYEIYGSHWFGQKAFQLNNDGTDIEPGVSWDVTPQLNFNPYLNIQTSGNVNLHSTSFGMMLHWRLL